MTKKTSLLLLLLFIGATSFFLSCKKERVDPTPQDDERLRENAAYNNNLLPGLGNVFYEKELIPGSESQLVSLIHLNGDTLAYFGKINSAKQLEYIHTMVLAKKNSSKLEVMEIFPATSSTRSYVIENGKKGRFVLESQNISATEYTIALLDYDWSTKQSKVISTVYMRGGVEVDRYEAKKKETLGNDNCPTPELLDGLDVAMEKAVKYFECIANPMVDPYKKKCQELIDLAKKLSKYSDQSEDLDNLSNSVDDQRSVIKTLTPKPSYKYDEIEIISQLEQLVREAQEAIDLLSTKLEVNYAMSDLEFNEYTDQEAVLTLNLLNMDTDMPIKKASVPVSMQVNGGEINITKLSDPTTGRVEFRFDPKKLKDYATKESFEVSYGFSSVAAQHTYKKTLTISFLKPRLLLSDGSPVDLKTIVFKTNTPVYFKLKSEVISNFSFDYSKVTIDKILKDDVKAEIEPISNGFSITLDAPSSQLTTITLKYDGRSVVGFLNAKYEHDPCSGSGLSVTTSRNGKAITANATGGKAPYSYKLINFTYSSTLGGSNTFNLVYDGDYRVVVQDANGCTDTSAIGCVNDVVITGVSASQYDGTSTGRGKLEITWTSTLGLKPDFIFQYAAIKSTMDFITSSAHSYYTANNIADYCQTSGSSSKFTNGSISGTETNGKYTAILPKSTSGSNTIKFRLDRSSCTGVKICPNNKGSYFSPEYTISW